MDNAANSYGVNLIKQNATKDNAQKAANVAYKNSEAIGNYAYNNRKEIGGFVSKNASAIGMFGKDVFKAAQ